MKGKSPVSSTYRVVLGSSAFIKGWLIAVLLWVTPLGLFLVARELIASAQSGDGTTHAPGVALAVLLYGFGAALVFAAPLAWVLAYLLRPVRNQWVHVAVFFAAPTLVFWTAGGLLGFGWSLGALGFWATVGAAAAIGRFAVRKNAALVHAGTRS